MVKSELRPIWRERSEEEIKGRKAADIIYHITLGCRQKAERHMWKMILEPGEKDGQRL